MTSRPVLLSLEDTAQEKENPPKRVFVITEDDYISGMV